MQTILWVFAAKVCTLFPDATFFNIRRNVYTWIDAMLVHLTKSASPDAGDEWQQEALVFLLQRHAELFESIRDGPAARSPPALALVSALAQQWCLHETRYVGPIRSKCRVVGLESADARLDGFWEPKRTWESSPFNASAKAPTWATAVPNSGASPVCWKRWRAQCAGSPAARRPQTRSFSALRHLQPTRDGRGDRCCSWRRCSGPWYASFRGAAIVSDRVLQDLCVTCYDRKNGSVAIDWLATQFLLYTRRARFPRERRLPLLRAHSSPPRTPAAFTNKEEQSEGWQPLCKATPFTLPLTHRVHRPLARGTGQAMRRQRAGRWRASASPSDSPRS